MSSDADAEESLLEFEAPKIAISLGKILGFAPIAIEIPLPKIRNPFSAVRSRPLLLPFKRLEVRFRAWWDALGAIPRFDGTTRSAMELEIWDAAANKIRGVEFALAPRKLQIDLALNELQPYRFKADAVVSAAQNQCAASLNVFADRRRRLQAWVCSCEKRVAGARQKLAQFVAERHLLSDKPYSVLKRTQNVIAVAVLYLVDLFMSVPLVAGTDTISLVYALWVSASFSLMNCVVGLAGGQFVAHWYFRKLSHEFQSLQKGLLIAWIAAGMLINLLFAMVRDQGSGQLSAMGAALFVVGLALFAIFGVKGFRDFADLHSGHLDLWTDLQNALAKLGKASRALASLQMQAAEASAKLHSQIREGVESYMGAIARTRRGAADCRSALEAQLDLVPSLGRGFGETASTLVALYRECNAFWRRTREPAPAPVPVPGFENPQYDIEPQIKKVLEFDTILKENEVQLQEFARKFEEYVAAALGPPAADPADTVREDQTEPPGDGSSAGVRRSANGDATIWPHR